MPVELIAVGLDGDDSTRSRCRIRPAGLSVIFEPPPGAARQLPQQSPIAAEGGTQDPGNRPHEPAVIRRFENLFGHPLYEGRYSLGLAGRTEVARLAGKSEQVLFVTAPTADAGKAVTQDPAFEKTLHRLLNHRPKGSVIFLVEGSVGLSELLPVMFQARVEGALLGVPLAVDRGLTHHLNRTFEYGETVNYKQSG